MRQPPRQQPRTPAQIRELTCTIPVPAAHLRELLDLLTLLEQWLYCPDTPGITADLDRFAATEATVVPPAGLDPLTWLADHALATYDILANHDHDHDQHHDYSGEF